MTIAVCSDAVNSFNYCVVGKQLIYSQVVDTVKFKICLFCKLVEVKEQRAVFTDISYELMYVDILQSCAAHIL